MCFNIVEITSLVLELKDLYKYWNLEQAAVVMAANLLQSLRLLILLEVAEICIARCVAGPARINLMFGTAVSWPTKKGGILASRKV